MYVYIYTYNIYVYIHTQTHTHKRGYIHTCSYIHAYNTLHTYIHTQTDIHTYIHTHIHTHTYIPHTIFETRFILASQLFSNYFFVAATTPTGIKEHRGASLSIFFHRFQLWYLPPQMGRSATPNPRSEL